MFPKMPETISTIPLQLPNMLYKALIVWSSPSETDKLKIPEVAMFLRKFCPSKYSLRNLNI